MSRVKKEDSIVTSLVRIVAGSSTGAHKKMQWIQAICCRKTDH
jgi:hypothetical protein